MKKVSKGMAQVRRRETEFLDRQREMQQLHQQLHTVFEDMNRVAPMISKFDDGSDGSTEEEDIDLNEIVALNKPEISAEQEVRLLVREIHQLLVDVQDLQSMLLERCQGRRKARITLMVQQLAELEHVLDGQKYRAEKLLR